MKLCKKATILLILSTLYNTNFKQKQQQRVSKTSEKVSTSVQNLRFPPPYEPKAYIEYETLSSFIILKKYL